LRLSLDSNILIYAADIEAGERHTVALDLVERALRGDCILTLQSLAEFFYVTTRKAKLEAPEAAGYVDDWRAAFPVRYAEERALADAVAAVLRHRLAFWDGLLWATVRRAGCRLLLSEDFQDGWSLGGVTVVNPFAPANAALLDAALPGPRA
jgi:predicted nucleic acid-binding protein